MADHKEESNIDIQNKLSNAEHYLETNKKTVGYILGAIALIIAGYFGYAKLILGPKEKEAQSQMFMAQHYFEMDSLNQAIKGDGMYLGFEAIADEYGMTDAANLAHYYLGISYLKQGKFEDAITHLKKFDTDDVILQPIAIGATGDAYMELGKTDEAAQYYINAASSKSNSFTSPLFLMKAGLAYEKSGKFNDAVKAYEKIKNEYAKSSEAQSIDKHIAFAKGSIK